jgi:hypothetical protein
VDFNEWRDRRFDGLRPPCFPLQVGGKHDGAAVLQRAIVVDIVSCGGKRGTFHAIRHCCAPGDPFRAPSGLHLSGPGHIINCVWASAITRPRLPENLQRGFEPA